MRIVLFVLFFKILVSFGQTVPEEASRHYYRGIAALEMAKTQGDYEAAIKEFEQAAILAPSWPDVYYKLGMAQAKIEKYDDAITNLKKYLQLYPEANDAETVKGLIYKLEYKRDIVKEKDAKINALLSGFSKMNNGNLNLPSVIKFTKDNDGIKANITLFSSKDFDQTVPVFFDGLILKFKFSAYRCPNATSLKQYPCEEFISVEGSVTATSPLAIKIKFTRFIKSSSLEEKFDGVWIFNQ